MNCKVGAPRARGRDLHLIAADVFYCWTKVVPSSRYARARAGPHPARAAYDGPPMSARNLVLFAATLVAAGGRAPAAELDFELYKTRVQPILLKKRPGGVPCATCHARVANSQLRLQPLAKDAATWSDEATRANFEALSAFVSPGEPTASRLLMHPLDRAAGGDPFH